MDREAIYAALFARLSSALPGYWASRDFLGFADINQWPAIVVNATNEHAEQDDSGNAPARWKLEAEVILYLARDPQQPFEFAIHAAIEAVVQALAPQPGESSYGRSYHTTLGDLADRAWVQGSIGIYREPGDLRATVLIPIEVHAY